MSYISVALRRLVTERARDRCEYCLFPQTASLFAFEMEHIIAEKHDGTTESENLALACPCCNRFKGSDLGSIDRETEQLTPFFHPRLQQWSDHFRLEGGLPPVGYANDCSSDPRRARNRKNSAIQPFRTHPRTRTTYPDGSIFTNHLNFPGRDIRF